MKIQNKTNNRPLGALLCILLLLFMGSILCILFGNSSTKAYTAHIYQDGQLIKTIDLSAVSESSQFTLETADGGYNTIEIRRGEIAVTAASCPDHVCMRQGFIHNSLLPITCLPNRLVIELKENTPLPTPDAITY